jgi:hypothetical protein
VEAGGERKDWVGLENYKFVVNLDLPSLDARLYIILQVEVGASKTGGLEIFHHQCTKPN